MYERESEKRRSSSRRRRRKRERKRKRRRETHIVMHAVMYLGLDGEVDLVEEVVTEDLNRDHLAAEEAVLGVDRVLEVDVSTQVTVVVHSTALSLGCVTSRDELL